MFLSKRCGHDAARNSRTAHEGPDRIDELNRAHLDAGVAPSSREPLYRHPVRVEAAVRRLLLLHLLLLLLLLVLRGGQPERDEEALLVEDGDGVDHQEGKVGDSAKAEKDHRHGGGDPCWLLSGGKGGRMEQLGGNSWEGREHGVSHCGMTSVYLPDATLESSRIRPPGGVARRTLVTTERGGALSAAAATRPRAYMDRSLFSTQTM